MFKKSISKFSAAIVFAAGLSALSASSASAVNIADGSTVSLVAMSSTMAGGGTCSTRTVISSSTRVRTLPDGENGEFDSATTNTFVWNSTHQAAFDVILARSGTTRTTFTPAAGTSYTFYQLKEGSTTAFYFCHAGQVDLMINGSNPITGWAVAGGIFFTAGESSGNSSNQNSQQAAAAQSAAVQSTAIALAKIHLTNQFAANKSATVDDFLNAGYGVRNNNVAAKVSASILKLPASERENSQKINEIISYENFIDRISVADTRSTVSALELVSRGLLPIENAHKYSVVQGLAKYPEGSLNTMAKIEAVIKEQIAKAEAPKLRLAAIKAKIAARNK
jgi:hypothetical protein